MLADTSTASERQALLGGGAQKSLIRSCFERCLFVLSDGQLLIMLVGLFILRMANTDALHGWIQGLVLTVKADVLFAILLVSCIICVGISIASIRLDQPGDLVCNVLWCCLTLTLMWYSMLQICELHSLEVECWLPKYCHNHPEKSGRPDLEGLANVLYSWSWLPLGFFNEVGGTLWKTTSSGASSSESSPSSALSMGKSVALNFGKSAAACGTKGPCVGQLIWAQLIWS